MNYTEAIEINIGDSRERTALNICHGCGALVASTNQHDAWHAQLNNNIKIAGDPIVGAFGGAYVKWPAEMEL
mgnify:CR=1 FL=1